MDSIQERIDDLARLYARHGIELTVRGKTATLKKGLITIKRSIRSRPR